jgi:hypothetical protein
MSTRRIYTVDLGSRSLHNTMTFSPNIVDVSILKVETINENGETITIYDTKTKLQSDISIRYDNVI